MCHNPTQTFGTNLLLMSNCHMACIQMAFALYYRRENPTLVAQVYNLFPSEWTAAIQRARKYGEEQSRQR